MWLLSFLGALLVALSLHMDPVGILIRRVIFRGAMFREASELPFVVVTAIQSTDIVLYMM